MAKVRSIRFRYTLRALLVFVTLFMLWGGYHTNRSWKERAAAEVLRRHGATFDYDKPSPKEGAWNHAVFAYQMLVRTLWGDRSITHVAVYSQLEPELVDALCALPRLERLEAQPERLERAENIRMHVTGEIEPTISPPPGAIKRILEHTNVQILHLGLWVLSDEDCRAIAQHRTLEGVDISGSDLSEEGLAHLLTLPRLGGFGFAFCDVTGEKLQGVPGSQSLLWVRCEHTPVGKEFAAFIGRSPNVAQLLCRGPGVDDDFVAALGPHPSLDTLDVRFATDRSIPLLEQMPALEHVVFSDKQVSDKGIARLKRAHPNINVVIMPFRKSSKQELLQ